MSKFWMMGVAAIAMSVAVVALGSRPVRSSEDLLGKAQSEFAVKARDALAQRRMAQASTAPALASATPAVPPSRYVVASLEPTIVASSEIVAPVAPTLPTEVVDSLEAPVASPQSPASPQPSAAVNTENDGPTEQQVAPLPPATPAAENVVTQQPAPAVAATPALKTVTPRGFTPTVHAPHETVKGARKTQRASSAPRTRTVVRRSEPNAPRNSMPYSIEMLRARAPEIAAAIARYM